MKQTFPLVVRAGWQRLTAPLDLPLLGICALLLLLAVGVMGSASPGRIGSQLTNMALALVVMRVVAGLSPQRLASVAVPVYLVGIGLLIGVALFGDISKGARRWLNLGFMRVQPSEIMNLAMPLLLAWFFHQRTTRLQLRDFFIAALLLLVPCQLLLVVQHLVAMGYGGNRTNSGQVTQQSADNGIDGIINEDPLGLDTIYLQAKRWQDPVGEAPVRDFIGALVIKGVKKGVFLTTSYFTPAARAAVQGNKSDQKSC